MNRSQKTYIQYTLIWKKLNNTISDEENKLLSKWLNESTENLQFFINAKEFESGKSPDTTNEDWLKVINKIEKRKNKRFFYYYSSAAIIIGIISILLLLPSNKDDIPLLAILPGVDKATLFLDNGNSILLENNTDFSIEEEGVKIKSEEGGLVYNSQKKKLQQTCYNTIQVPRGGEYFIILSDSTKVWINSETTLRYPTSFKKNERVVEVMGEAYFEVKEDKTTPFVVVSGQQAIKVTGTAFNVSTYGKDGDILTTLVEGSVQLYPLSNPELVYNLKPGNQGRFNTNNLTIQISEVDVSLFTSWKDGYYYFQDETIEDMLTTLSRWYDFDFQVNNEKVKSVQFTGKLKRTELFQRIISVLEKTGEVNCTISNNMIFVDKQ